MISNLTELARNRILITLSLAYTHGFERAKVNECIEQLRRVYFAFEFVDSRVNDKPDRLSWSSERQANALVKKYLFAI